MGYDNKLLGDTGISGAGLIDSNLKKSKLAADAFNTLTSTGVDRQEAAAGGAKTAAGQLISSSGAGWPAKEAAGAAFGLANVLSAPAGSQERAQIAQKELISAAGIVPVAGKLAATALVDQINKEFGPKEGEVKEGDGLKVDGTFGGELQANGDIKVGDQTVKSENNPADGNVDDIQVTGQLNGDNAKINPDGSIDTGNGQTVSGDGELKGGGSTVSEGDDFTVKGELNGDNPSISGDTIITGNGQLVTPEGDVVNQGEPAVGTDTAGPGE